MLGELRLSPQRAAAYFFEDQCHNPRAEEYAQLYNIALPMLPGSWFHVLVPDTSPVRSSTYLLHAWADAFGV